MNFEMQRGKSIHLIGVGGCGMSAIAKILHQMEYKVSGSDVKESANTIRLKDLGVKLFFEHEASNVRGADLVVYSSAIAKDNVELVAARERDIPIIQRAEMLAWIMEQSKISIAVAGTHGKTTTTSMLALIFEKSGLNPTYLVGGEANDVEGNARLGNGRYVVAEADESDGSFLKLHPKLSVITNIEEDHLDHYGSLGKIMEAFIAYAETIASDGLIVINNDHPNCRVFMQAVSGKRRILTYGLNQEADLRAANIEFEENVCRFDVIGKGKEYGRMQLSIPGVQNVINALGALLVGLELGEDFGTMSRILQTFVGARRRFQLLGSENGIMVYDDYAHHPTEIEYTLRAAKGGWPAKRIIVVFQPHRYTRTHFLKEEFAKCFSNADLVIAADIYSAGEDPIPGVSGEIMAREIQKHHPKVEYIPRKEKIAEFLVKEARSNDMIITVGAGDIYTVGKEFLGRIRQQSEAAR